MVLDLKGFTIIATGNESDIGVTIGATTEGVVNAYPITIRNGTINSTIGVFAANGSALSDITVNKIVFNALFEGNGQGVYFQNVSSSTISNCTFNNSDISGVLGISDNGSQGGNTYNNDTFVKTAQPIAVVGRTPLVLDRCQFSPPPSN